jgi:hypothetical protein
MFKYLNNLTLSSDNPAVNTEFDSIGAIFGFLLNVGIGVGIALSIVFMIVSGIQRITSYNNPQQMENGSRHFWHSIIALVATLLSYTIKIAIFNTLGVTGDDIVNNVPNF